jgi:hypothetical protein
MAPTRTFPSYALRHYPLTPYELHFGTERSVCRVRTPFQDLYAAEGEMIPPGPPALSFAANDFMALNALDAPHHAGSVNETGLIPAPGIHPGREDRPGYYSLPKVLTGLGWSSELYAKFKVRAAFPGVCSY